MVRRPTVAVPRRRRGRARGIRTRSATRAHPSRWRCGRRSRVSRRTDAGVGGTVLDRLDAIDVVYCQTWQYDDPAGRLADRLGVEPKPPALLGHRRHDAAGARAGHRPSGSCAASWTSRWSWARKHSATQRRYKAARRAIPVLASSREEKRPFPWEAPFHPAEVAHEVFQAWLTFAIFDNARRGHLGVALDGVPRRSSVSSGPAFTEVAAANPRHGSRSSAPPSEIITADAREPHGRLPVHEVHGLDHGRRHGRRAAAGQSRSCRCAQRAARTAGSTCGAGATRRIRSTSPSTPTCGDSPAIAHGGRRRALDVRGRRGRRRRALRPVLVLRLAR